MILTGFTWYFFLFQKQQSRRGDYRQYSPTSLHTALPKILNKNMTMYKASKVYGIPKSTLLDRVSERVGVDVVKSGPAPTLDVEQETRLVEHIKMMANFGYGYNFILFILNTKYQEAVIIF